MMFSLSNVANNDVLGMLGFSGSGFMMGIAYLITLVYINLSGMYYIKSYIENKGNVNEQDIMVNTRGKFWSFTGFAILAFIIFIASAFLCFFPAFYTWTVLSLGASILVFENESATSTIGKCFNFVSGYFWETFGVIFVVSLLVSVLGYVFQVPATIYQLVKMGIGFGVQDPTEVLDLYKDPIYLILYIISMVGQLMFYSITLITNVFLYFDINEQRNLTGTMEKIDGLGQ